MGDEEVPINFYKTDEHECGHGQGTVIQGYCNMNVQGTRKKPKRSKRQEDRLDFWHLNSEKLSKYICGLFLRQNPNLSSLENDIFPGLDPGMFEQTGEFSVSNRLVVIPQLKQLQSCQILVLSSSATRCIDLIKQISRCGCRLKVGKLFGRHIKMEEQIVSIQKQKFSIAVGTPARALSIAQNSPIIERDLRYLFVDVHRDVKLRSIFDIPETSKPLLDLIFIRFYRLFESKRLKFLFIK